MGGLQSRLSGKIEPATWNAPDGHAGRHQWAVCDNPCKGATRPPCRVRRESQWPEQSRPRSAPMRPSEPRVANVRRRHRRRPNRRAESNPNRTPPSGGGGTSGRVPVRLIRRYLAGTAAGVGGSDEPHGVHGWAGETRTSVPAEPGNCPAAVDGRSLCPAAPAAVRQRTPPNIAIHGTPSQWFAPRKACFRWVQPKWPPEGYIPAASWLRAVCFCWFMRLIGSQVEAAKHELQDRDCHAGTVRV